VCTTQARTRHLITCYVCPANDVTSATTRRRKKQNVVSFSTGVVYAQIMLNRIFYFKQLKQKFKPGTESSILLSPNKPVPLPSICLAPVKDMDSTKSVAVTSSEDPPGKLAEMVPFSSFEIVTPPNACSTAKLKSITNYANSFQNNDLTIQLGTHSQIKGDIQLYKAVCM